MAEDEDVPLSYGKPTNLDGRVEELGCVFVAELAVVMVGGVEHGRGDGEPVRGDGSELGDPGILHEDAPRRWNLYYKWKGVYLPA